MTQSFWLVRTAKNRISGPYEKQELCRRLEEGQWNLEDEVCPSNGYWIFLHEAEEIRQQLGVELPLRLMPSEEEITETQTETQTETASLVSGGASRLQEGRASEGMALDLSADAPPVTEDTAQLSNRALREFHSKKKSQAPNSLQSSFSAEETEADPSRWKKGIERSLYWYLLVWLLVFAMGLIIVTVLRLLRP